MRDIKKIVVIGASAAGLRAAARAKRLLPEAGITVIDEGEFISYSACGMPYVISGDVGSIKALQETPYGLVRDPDFFHDIKGLDVYTRLRVEKIDRETKRVFCLSLATGQRCEYEYDRLVIATGATPVLPPAVPARSERIVTFKTLPDAMKLNGALQKGVITKVAIVGAGAVGCEMAEALAGMWGAQVVMIEAASHVLPNMLDEEMGRLIERRLAGEGVEVHVDCPLKGIEERDDGLIIKTSKAAFAVDYALIAVGVRPNTALAAHCGLKIGPSGGIVVDEKLLTSDPSIYAAGDCVEVKHRISGKPMNLPLGSLANRQGRAVGSNLAGGEERFGGVLGSAAVKVFDMNVCSTGLTEKAAKDAGFDAAAVWGTFTDKADYYPEAHLIQMKMVFDRGSSRLLGLQAMGKGETVKRVDVFAALLKDGGTLEDLLDAEFAYAPPYTPALDPLFVLGAMAGSVLKEGLQAVAPSGRLGDYVILDVRQEKEANSKPIDAPTVVHIPLGDLRRRCHEIPRDKPLLCVCPRGLRAAEASRLLRAKGLKDVAYLGGGLNMLPSSFV